MPEVGTAATSLIGDFNLIGWFIGGFCVGQGSRVGTPMIGHR